LNFFSIDKRFPDDQIFAKETFGFPHLQSFKALAISAASCDLCSLMSESVTDLVTTQESTETHPKLKFKLSENVRGDFQLWLTRRVDGGDGFLVFARVGNKNMTFLVAAIGLCVNDGKCLPLS
jgi:hypothetical protein